MALGLSSCLKCIGGGSSTGSSTGSSPVISSPRSSGSSFHLTDLFRKEFTVLPPAFDHGGGIVPLTTETVKDNISKIIWTGDFNEDAARLMSCALQFQQVSAQTHDFNTLFPENITAEYVGTRDDGLHTTFGFVLNEEAVECTSLHLALFQKINHPQLDRVYITKLGTCTNYVASGGKSNSPFMVTADDHFIVKRIKEEEYKCFDTCGHLYLDHIGHVNTCLNRPWGVFKVVTSQATGFYLATDKTQIPQANDSLLFDLKGIKGRAKSPTSPAGSTGLDNDFERLMLAEDVHLSQQDMQTMINKLTNDTRFLQGVNIMDYSLLVAWDKSTGTITYNIIDYLVPFNLTKKLEFAAKRSKLFVYGQFSQFPTVVPPVDYATRLKKFLVERFGASYE